MCPDANVPRFLYTDNSDDQLQLIYVEPYVIEDTKYHLPVAFPLKSMILITKNGPLLLSVYTRYYVVR